MKKEFGMTLPKEIKIGVNKDGSDKTVILYHDLQDLKSKETFEEYTQTKGNKDVAYDEYLNLIAKLAFTKDFKDLRKEYSNKVDAYNTVKSILEEEKINDLEESYKEHPANYEEMRYIESASSDFVKSKIDEYTMKMTALNQKISLINFVAKKKNMRLIEDKEITK